MLAALFACLQLADVAQFLRNDAGALQAHQLVGGQLRCRSDARGGGILRYRRHRRTVCAAVRVCRWRIVVPLPGERVCAAQLRCGHGRWVLWRWRIRRTGAVLEFLAEVRCASLIPFGAPIFAVRRSARGVRSGRKLAAGATTGSRSATGSRRRSVRVADGTVAGGVRAADARWQRGAHATGTGRPIRFRTGDRLTGLDALHFGGADRPGGMHAAGECLPGDIVQLLAGGPECLVQQRARVVPHFEAGNGETRNN